MRNFPDPAHMIIYLYSLPNSLTLSHSDTNMIFLKSCNYYKDFYGCNYDWSIWSQIIPLFLFVTEILKTIFIWVGFSTWLSKLKTYDWAPLSLSFCKFPCDTIFLSAWSCQSHKNQNIWTEPLQVVNEWGYHSTTINRAVSNSGESFFFSWDRESHNTC